MDELLRRRSVWPYRRCRAKLGIRCATTIEEVGLSPVVDHADDIFPVLQGERPGITTKTSTRGRHSYGFFGYEAWTRMVGSRARLWPMSLHCRMTAQSPRRPMSVSAQTGAMCGKRTNSVEAASRRRHSCPAWPLCCTFRVPAVCEIAALRRRQ